MIYMYGKVFVGELSLCPQRSRIFLETLALQKLPISLVLGTKACRAEMSRLAAGTIHGNDHFLKFIERGQ